MPVRMFVALSDRVGAKHLAGMSAGDIVVVGPGVEPDLPAGVDTRKVPTASDDLLRQVAMGLANGLRETTAGDGRDLVECVINDAYAYSLRPVVSTLEFIRRIIDEKGVSHVTVVAAGRHGHGLPLVGFRTTESPRGSRELLGACIAQAIVTAFPGIDVDVRKVRSDFYCVEPFRKAFMVCANLFFIALFLLKCVAFLRGRSPGTAGAGGPGFIVRVPHQARFAARIMSGRSDATILAFPQASQGSLRSFGRMLRNDLGGCAVEPVRMRGLAKALVETVRDITTLKEFARNPHRVDIGVSGINVQVDLSDLARELMIFPILLLYKNVLAESVSASACGTLVTFELVGRMAGLESLVTRRAGIRSITVQTALVSAIPHVVFPWSNLFLTDGPEVANRIGAVGAIGYGRVRYAGSAFSIEDVKQTIQAREIVFFTQPYEPAVTLEMLRLLCEEARANGGRVYLKVHPRDDEARYRNIESLFQDVLYPVRCSPDLLLGRVDLCVTRTSSVAKEAIAAGIPIVLCLWTKLDRSVRADYVRPGEGLGYCSSSPEDLRPIIANSVELNRAATELRGLLFGGLGIEDLRRVVFAEEATA